VVVHNLYNEFTTVFGDDRYHIVIDEVGVTISKMNTWGKYDQAKTVDYEQLYGMIEW